MRKKIIFSVLLVFGSLSAGFYWWFIHKVSPQKIVLANRVKMRSTPDATSDANVLGNLRLTKAIR
jgi:hypothetical protein